MIVFSKGILNGSKILIPVGGQINPISITGANLEWKNVQKNEIKKNTSDVINKIIPHFNPITTCLEWNPWNVLSREISRHHWYMIIKVDNNLINNRSFSLKLNILIIPRNVIIDLSAPRIGHGL